LRRLSQSPARSTVAGSSLLGSVSCRDKPPLAAKRAWAGSANEATLIFGAWLVNGAHALRSKAAKADPWLIAFAWPGDARRLIRQGYGDNQARSAEYYP
jgi:hypothetical protein